MIKDILLISIAVLISSIVTLFVLTPDHPTIVVVDQKALFKDMVLKISNSVESQDEKEIAKKVQKYEASLKNFQQKMAEIATENNLVILYKDNVIGGAVDQTQEAQILLKELMEEVDVIKK